MMGATSYTYRATRIQPLDAEFNLSLLWLVRRKRGCWRPINLLQRQHVYYLARDAGAYTVKLALALLFLA
jgi:hypothetical protein